MFFRVNSFPEDINGISERLECIEGNANWEGDMQGGHDFGEIKSHIDSIYDIPKEIVILESEEDAQARNKAHHEKTPAELFVFSGGDAPGAEEIHECGNEKQRKVFNPPATVKVIAHQEQPEPSSSEQAGMNRDDNREKQEEL